MIGMFAQWLHEYFLLYIHMYRYKGSHIRTVSVTITVELKCDDMWPID